MLCEVLAHDPQVQQYMTLFGKWPMYQQKCQQYLETTYCLAYSFCPAV